MKKKTFTQDDVDAAFSRGVMLGWHTAQLTPKRGRGRPKLEGRHALEAAYKKYGKAFVHIFMERHTSENPLRGVTQIIADAAEKFHMDKRTLERAYRRWEPAMVTFDELDLEFELVEKYCTDEERRAAGDELERTWSHEAERNLVRLAKKRARANGEKIRK